MALKTTPFDAAKYLRTPDSQLELILEAFDTGDQEYLDHAIETAARAKAMHGPEQASGTSLAADRIHLPVSLKIRTSVGKSHSLTYRDINRAKRSARRTRSAKQLIGQF